MRLVNAGIKVFVTTHSDYIVREFNTLIMLDNDTPALDRIRQREGYESDDRLSPSRVRLYMLMDDLIKKNGNQRRSRVRVLREASISPTLGIEVESFDDTIKRMNAIQDDIYYNSSEQN